MKSVRKQCYFEHMKENKEECSRVLKQWEVIVKTKQKEVAGCPLSPSFSLTSQYFRLLNALPLKCQTPQLSVVILFLVRTSTTIFFFPRWNVARSQVVTSTEDAFGSKRLFPQLPTGGLSFHTAISSYCPSLQNVNGAQSIKVKSWKACSPPPSLVWHHESFKILIKISFPRQSPHIN